MSDEQIKLLATTLNNLDVGSLLAGIIVPWVNHTLLGSDAMGWHVFGLLGGRWNDGPVDRPRDRQCDPHSFHRRPTRPASIAAETPSLRRMTAQEEQFSK